MLAPTTANLLLSMKILAVYFRAGSGVSVIYERVIEHLAKHAEVDILSDQAPISNMKSVRNIYTHPFSKSRSKWYRKFVRWFGATPFSSRWSREAMAQLTESYDLVIAFVTSAQLTPVVFGRHYAEQHNIKFAIYSVDAIPAPGGWTKPREYRGKMRVVARNFAAADYVASSNAHMLDFQLTTFKHKEGLRSNVLLTPSPAKEYNLPAGERATFLYTGSLYGLRNPDYFFKAFKRLLREYHDAEAIFVGMGMKFRNMRSILSAEELKRVTVLGHTDNLEPLFSRATVLVDINADREQDPFLSSKIITYLKTNRIIVCETGRDTPSREVFAGLDTIILADHSAESLYDAMKLALERAHSNPNYAEREAVIRRFSIEEVGDIFWNDIVDMCK